MKNKNKLLLGCLLVIGLIVVTSTLISPAIHAEEPPEDEDEDPGNARGPGVWTSLPDLDEFSFIQGETLYSQSNLL